MRAHTSCDVMKWKVGSETDCRLNRRGHTLPVEGQSGRCSQHSITGSKDESTHKLWKDEVGGEVSIRSQA